MIDKRLENSCTPIEATADYLLPCDIVAVRGTSWVSRRILQLTGGRISHVGFVITPGSLQSAIIQESVTRVIRDTIPCRYSSPVNAASRPLVGIYRPMLFDSTDRDTILAAANHSLGLHYGYSKLFLHLADSLLPTHPYLFRRLGVSRYPVCSGDLARCWEVAGYSFGVESGAATPADIYNFCYSRPDKYREIRRLSPI